MRRNGSVAAACALVAGCYTPHVTAPDASTALWRGESARGSPVRLPAQLDAPYLVKLALQRHPELVPLRARVDAARAAVSEAGQWENPELRVTELRLDEVVDEQTSIDVALRIRPERPGMIDSRVDRATHRVAARRARVAMAELSLAARVRRLHAAAILSAREAEVALREAKLRGEVRALVESRIRAGDATELDVALADLALAEVEDTARSLAADHAESVTDLRRLLSLPPDAALELGGPPGGVDTNAPKSYDAAAVIGEALRARPEADLRLARLAEAEVDRWRAEAERWPWLRFAQVGRALGPGEGTMAWGFAVGLELPVFTWNAGAVAARRADSVVRQRQHQATVTGIVRQVEGALKHRATMASRLEELRERLLPAAEAAEQAAAKAGRARALAPWRAVRLEISRLRAHRRHLAAERDLVAATIALDASLGRTGAP